MEGFLEKETIEQSFEDELHRKQEKSGGVKLQVAEFKS